MRCKVAVGSYHVFYVNNALSEEDAVDIVIDKLRSVADSDASDRMQLADCETTLDFAVSLD